MVLKESKIQNREQRVVLNGQTSEWRKINSGVPQGSSVLGPLLFLIYVNDLSDGLTSICKTFADDTSLFSKVFKINESANDLNTDFEKISQLTCNSILIPTNKQMELFFHGNQILVT